MKRRNITIFALMILAGTAALAAQVESTPSSSVRLAEWNISRPGTPIPVAISFAQPMSDDAVLSLLRRHHAIPYAVYMHFGDLYGTHRMAEDQASEAVIAQAREESIKMQEEAARGTQARAHALLAELSSPGRLAKDDQLRQNAQALVERSQVSAALLHSAKEREPLIYAVEALVAVHDAKMLLQDSEIVSAEPAAIRLTRAGLRAVVPQPQPPAVQVDSRSTSELSPTLLYQELQRLAGAELR